MISQPNHSVKRKSLVIGSKYKTRLFLFIFVFLLPNYYLLVFLVTIVNLRSQNYNSKLKIKSRGELSSPRLRPWGLKLLTGN